MRNEGAIVQRRIFDLARHYDIDMRNEFVLR